MYGGRSEFRQPLDQKSAPAVRTIAPRPIIDSSVIIGLWNTVAKQSDEARVSSAVLTADGVLKFPVVSGGRYVARCKVFFDTAATPDFQWSLTGPALTRIRVERCYIVPAATAYTGIGVDTAGYTAAQALVGAGTTGGYVEFDLAVTPSADGTISFMWAQNTSDPAATTVLAGSFLEWMKVA